MEIQGCANGCAIFDNNIKAAVRFKPALKYKYVYRIDQCFSTAGPRPGTGPWHQLYRAARGSLGIFHFSFLSNFHE